MGEQTKRQPFTVAVVGCGIVGSVLTLALIQRGIPVKVYDQSIDIKTTGGGINAHPAGVKALKRCANACYEAFREVMTHHHKENPLIYFTLTDGPERMHIMPCYEEFGSMRRSVFHEGLMARLPKNAIHYDKRVKSVTEEQGKPVTIQFEDGSETTADIVIGCDGLNSKVRPFVVGKDHPSSTVRFTNLVMYRGLLSASESATILGDELVKGAHIGIGNKDGYVYYPISDPASDLVNFGYYRVHPEPWPHGHKTTAPTTKTKLLEDMEAAGADERKIGLVNMFPEEIDMWALFDLYDYPLPTYCNGRIAVAGDAAHASVPFLGSGAGQGWEDAAVIADLCERVMKDSSCDEAQSVIHHRLATALAAFSSTRMERSQSVVQSSRDTGIGLRGGLIWEEIIKDYPGRSYKIWKGEIDEIVDAAMQKYLHDV